MPKLDETGARHRPLQHRRSARPTPEASNHCGAAAAASHCISCRSLPRAAVEAGIEQLAGLGLAGGGAAMLDDDVEPVVGVEAAEMLIWLATRADIGFDRLGRSAGGAGRAVEAGADQALDAQRRVVDRDRDAGRGRACRPTRVDLESEVEAGAEATARRAAARPSGSGRRPSVRSIVVPGLISPSGTAPPTSVATCVGLGARRRRRARAPGRSRRRGPASRAAR